MYLCKIRASYFCHRTSFSFSFYYFRSETIRICKVYSCLKSSISDVIPAKKIIMKRESSLSATSHRDPRDFSLSICIWISTKCIKICQIAHGCRMLLCVMSRDKSWCQHVVARAFVCPFCVADPWRSRGGLGQKCILGYVSPMLPWCAGFQGAMIIHCAKTNLRQIRCTGCIQGNRIEAALTAFHSQRHDNMIFGLLHYRKCHLRPVGGGAGGSSYTIWEQCEF